MKKKKILLAVLSILLLSTFYLEEHKHYEILHSTVMSSPNLTENTLTLVVHSLLPIDKESLSEEIVKNHLKLNGGSPNPYYKLELYRTRLHY